MDIKVRLAVLEKTQVSLLKEVKKRGFSNVQPPNFSRYVNGLDTTPQAMTVLKIADDILKKWESSSKMG